jgi:dTDP-4-dehydrorhamnose reductase
MRCLIIGGDGMLGHQLLASWQGRHEVRVTLRRVLDAYVEYGLFDATNAFDNLDVRDSDRLQNVLGDYRPDAVINAAGVIKQRDDVKQSLPCLEINAVFPHRLRELCETVGARLVHVSTDCVFTGKRGGYTESDSADAEDLYGLSKYLGEVGEAPAVTLRTSIIGLELSRNASLIEWFLAQRGTIKGFTKAIYTGVTTLELARVIEHVLLRQPELTGVWQVASDPISKHALLSDLATFLQRSDLEITPDDDFHCDRSLKGDAFIERTGYTVPDWNTMLTELAAQIKTRQRTEEVNANAA